MLKTYSRLVSILLAITDILALNSALILAWYIRFEAKFFLKIFPLIYGYRPLSDFFNIYTELIIVSIYLIIAKANNLYKTSRWRSTINLFFLIFSSVTLSLTILAGLAFFYRAQSYSRLTVAIFWFLSITFIFLTRILWREIFQYLRKKGIIKRNILILGAGKIGKSFIKKINDHPELGINPIGFLDDDEMKVGKTIEKVKILGTLKDLNKILKKEKIHDIYIALPLSAQRKALNIINSIKDELIDIKIIPDLFDYITLNTAVEDFEGIPIINLNHTPLSGWNAIIKRLMDITLSLLGIVITLPITIPTAILIKLTSKGPIFYKQERMGLDGKRFMMLKFRSMILNAESKTGPVFAVENDPRVTPVGRIIRKLGIDELPQLINVLKGEMSLVGPRPERPPFVENFKKRIPNYMLRHKVKSGITGWAQVNGFRGNTSIEKRLEYDIYYIKNWNLLFDIKILLLTLIKFHKNAV